MGIHLRDYQHKAVNAVLRHFRGSLDPALLVLPTGAGKSHVIAELGKLARGRVLVLAHVKELVEQNHAKYEALGFTGDIYAAGLKRRESSRKVVFGSVQSVARHLDEFDVETSLLIVDECHRISDDEDSQYHAIFKHLKEINPNIKILGLTATPYRLGMGWIFKYHFHGRVHSAEPRFFHTCVYELSLRYLIRKEYLTPPRVVGAFAAQYHFGDLKPGASGKYSEADIEKVLKESKRATPKIIKQVIELAKDRRGVMIFAATVPHAREILGYLPKDESALILGETPQVERDALIQSFKQQDLKYLVNVSVLTTGFDAPHVDIIAILRPTESVSLFQQIVGRGLRLYPDKADCLILDYADNGYDIFAPEVGSHRPDKDSEQVQVLCPACGFGNIYWGKVDENGVLIEHYGRRCQGFEEDEKGKKVQCDYRFRFKICGQCGAENDIAGRQCHSCGEALIDADKKLREVLKMKNSKVIRCAGMLMGHHKTRKGADSLKITYFDEDGAELEEYYRLDTKGQRSAFFHSFVRQHHKAPGTEWKAESIDEVLAQQGVFRVPDFVVAYKEGKFWKIREKLFDYEGRFRKANEEY